MRAIVTIVITLAACSSKSEEPKVDAGVVVQVAFDPYANADALCGAPECPVDTPRILDSACCQTHRHEQTGEESKICYPAGARYAASNECEFGAQITASHAWCNPKQCTDETCTGNDSTTRYDVEETLTHYTCKRDPFDAGKFTWGQDGECRNSIEYTCIDNELEFCRTGSGSGSGSGGDGDGSGSGSGFAFVAQHREWIRQTSSWESGYYEDKCGANTPAH